MFDPDAETEVRPVSSPDAERQQRLRARAEAHEVFGGPPAARPGPAHIVLGPEEDETVQAAAEALGQSDKIYQRGGALVEVVRHLDSPVGPTTAPYIRAVPAPTLRSELTVVASWWRVVPPKAPEGANGHGGDRAGEMVRVHPPRWAIDGVLTRGSWPAVRPLAAVVECPVLRPDGTVLQSSGYDPDTGLVYWPSDAYGLVPPNPSLEDARRAAASLYDLVSDFPFADPVHLAGWYAALLTPFARYLFPGPAPLFMIDKNVRGAGGSLLADTIGLLVTGRPLARASFVGDEDEMRKQITSVALMGAPLVLFDNVVGTFATATLDRALTSTMWQDRALGRNEVMTLPLCPTWYATGNNLRMRSDTARRTLRIRLAATDERPEDRVHFRHADLLQYILRHRHVLVPAALTILRAWIVAGRPAAPTARTWGSFEGWSSVLPPALQWLGLGDVHGLREQLAAESDDEADALEVLLEGWETLAFECGVATEGLSVVDALARLRMDSERAAAESDRAPRHGGLRGALEELTHTSPGKPLQAYRVGLALKSVRDRVAGGRVLQWAKGKRTNKGRRWVVLRTSTDPPALPSGEE